MLSLAFSPCPNDTFIFDALVNGRIDTGALRFQVHLEDVQTLNEWALEGRMDISKISYGVWPLVSDTYDLLESGGALGKGVGPLLIARSPIPLSEIPKLRIAIPGKNTTANLLFSMAFPQATRKEYMVFHGIEQAVLDGKVDAGVIIHENRFTYQQKGLHKLIDLGDHWEQSLQCPIPLGGIVVRKNIPAETRLELDRLIRESILYSWKSYPQLSEYVKCHAQEMSEEVMRQHISLYVNDFSLQLGPAGHRAVDQLERTFRNLQEGN